MSFLTAEEFEQRKVQHDSIIAWRDVPQNVIYRVENVQDIPTQKGRAMVVSLVDVEGKQFKAFATNILEKALADFNWNSGTYFIKSLGLKQSTTCPGKSYYHFELVKEDN